MLVDLFCPIALLDQYLDCVDIDVVDRIGEVFRMVDCSV